MTPDPATIGPLGVVIVLTDRSQAASAGHELVDVVARAAQAGAGAVIFREKDLGADERLALGESIASVLEPTATALVVASDPALAERIGARGVHLAQRDVDSPGVGILVGHSCHDPVEVQAALDAGADYVTLSPIFASSSKPGHGPPLGVESAESAPSTHPPLYALGGVTAANAGACLAAGFAGVAVMGAVMADPDPGRVVADLLAAAASIPESVR